MDFRWRGRHWSLHAQKCSHWEVVEWVGVKSQWAPDIYVSSEIEVTFH